MHVKSKQSHGHQWGVPEGVQPFHSTRGRWVQVARQRAVGDGWALVPCCRPGLERQQSALHWALDKIILKHESGLERI